MLYVGVAYPHKNLAGLMDAFKIFYDKYSKEYNLILAGPDNYFYRKLKYPRLFGGQAISYIGFVSDSELRALYKNASLYVFPSLYEGFGLPVLESMACGTPVVCSNSGSFADVAADAAIFCDPKSPQDIAEKIAEDYTELLKAISGYIKFLRNQKPS